MKRIYLIGYMGSGKSTVGRGIAKKLGLQFIDLDTYIEERNLKTIPELFSALGEEGFRIAEQKALHEVSLFENIVVATGGGAPCFFDNMEVLKRTGTSVYLNGTPRILAERLIKSKTERPLIKGKSEQELIAFIDETLNKRREFYLQADVVIPFDRNLSIGEIMQYLGKK